MSNFKTQPCVTQAKIRKDWILRNKSYSTTAAEETVNNRVIYPGRYPYDSKLCGIHNNILSIRLKA